MYAVSVSEDGGFGLTMARFNIEEEWTRYDEDSGAI
jgi:hypothetical protein